MIEDKVEASDIINRASLGQDTLADMVSCDPDVWFYLNYWRINNRSKKSRFSIRVVKMLEMAKDQRI